MILTIPGKLTTLNEYISANNRSRYIANGLKSVDTQKVEWAIKASKLRPITGKHMFRFDWIRQTRKTDPDNLTFGAKAIFDALVKQKILPNDGWKYVGVILHRFFQRDEDRTELEITKI